MRSTSKLFKKSELGTCPFCKKRMTVGGPAGKGKVWQDCWRCGVSWDGDQMLTMRDKEQFKLVPDGSLLVMKDVPV